MRALLNEHMGAVVEGSELSTILPGRRIPRMRYKL